MSPPAFCRDCNVWWKEAASGRTRGSGAWAASSGRSSRSPRDRLSSAVEKARGTGRVMKTAEIGSFSERAMEGVLVEGVPATLGEAKITLRLHDLSGVQVQVFGALAGAGFVVDVIVQVPGPDELVHLTFTV